MRWEFARRTGFFCAGNAIIAAWRGGRKMYFFWDWTYVILLPAIVLSLIAQMRVSAAYNRYSQVASRRGVTATDVVRGIFHREGIQNVKIEATAGHLSDHYDLCFRCDRHADHQNQTVRKRKGRNRAGTDAGQPAAGGIS